MCQVGLHNITKRCSIMWNIDNILITLLTIDRGKVQFSFTFEILNTLV